MAQILRHSQAIRGHLRQLFSESTRGRRRVIIVAYVGRDAPRLLPDYADVELYCWPQPGATNPNALAMLREPDHGARIFLCDGLHMKLYWVEGIGSIVTSANLSDRALGERTLHEFGVFLPSPDGIDIDAVLGGLDARELTTRELRRLQRAHDVYWSNNRLAAPGTSLAERTYTEWYEGGREREWKLAWWDTARNEADSSARRAHSEFGVSDIVDYMDGHGKDYQVGDWVLCYEVKGLTVGPPSWLFVQDVNRLTAEEVVANDGYSHQAIQATPLARYNEPPFTVTPAFSRSFRKACKNYGVEQRQHGSLKPADKFLMTLYQSAERSECACATALRHSPPSLTSYVVT